MQRPSPAGTSAQLKQERSAAHTTPALNSAPASALFKSVTNTGELKACVTVSPALDTTAAAPCMSGDPLSKPSALMDIREMLARHFGYSAFRPGQEDAIRAVLGGM